MDNFQRAREAPPKKSRLSEDQAKHSSRAFFQKPSQSQPIRHRAENNDLSFEGTYQPQVQQHHELVSQYKNALSELTFNSKPIITNLTIIAGENLYAAKSISATVCANILEVPNEHKLPSLYLLDSIVKNIGRDYIKYFAARLPEVFCNSYRQVDPSVLPSMRHLFGTWRGVFSSQPLQAIEKELGFTSSIKTSSSGTVVSNVDSQLKRPPHSIHINPKYLEKQRLQQSNQGKGMKNEVAVPISTFTDEMNKPGRKASVGGQDWSEVPGSMHSYGEAPCQSKFGTNTSHRDREYGSDVSRSPEMGIGRTGRRAIEHGLDRHGYQVERNDAKEKTAQINGFERKNEYLNYMESRFIKADLHQDPMQISAKGSSGLSTSWRSSEEEFKWETLSGILDQGASKIFSTTKKNMIAGDSMKLESINHLQKPPSLTELELNMDVGMRSDLPSIEHIEPIRLGHFLSPSEAVQEPYSTDRMALSGNAAVIKGRPEHYSETLGGLCASASSLAKTAVRTPMESSHSGNFSFGFSTDVLSGVTGTKGQQRFRALSSSPPYQSPTHQDPSSLSFASENQHYQGNNFSEQECPGSQLALPDFRTPHSSASLLPSYVHFDKLNTVQSEGLHDLSPAVSFKPSHQHHFLQPQPFGSVELEPLHLKTRPNEQRSSTSGSLVLRSPSLEHCDQFSSETSPSSSSGSLHIPGLKTEVLSDATTSGLPVVLDRQAQKIGSQHVCGPVTLSGSTAVSTSLSVPSTCNINATVDVSKTEPPLPPGPPPASQSLNKTSNSSNSLSDLLSSLLSKGLISALSREASLFSSQISAQSQNFAVKPPDSVALSSLISTISSPAIDELSFVEREPDLKAPSESPQKTAGEVDNLIGLEFKSDLIRELHPNVIDALTHDLPHQCSICGIRLKFMNQLDKHLKSHACKEQRLDGMSNSKGWYVGIREWIIRNTEVPYEVKSPSLMDEFQKSVEKSELMIPADEDQCVCFVCGEMFEDYYCLEGNRWMFIGAVHMAAPSGADQSNTPNQRAKGIIAHASCMSENLIQDVGFSSGI